MEKEFAQAELDAIEEAFAEWRAQFPAIDELINLQEMEEMSRLGELPMLITASEPF